MPCMAGLTRWRKEHHRVGHEWVTTRSRLPGNVHVKGKVKTVAKKRRRRAPPRGKSGRFKKR